MCDSHLTCKVANKCLNVRDLVEVVEWNKMVLSLPLLSCKLSVSVKENPDRKKKKVANFGIIFEDKHFLIKPILGDDLCNFTDTQYKSLYKTTILFCSLKFNKFAILRLRHLHAFFHTTPFSTQLQCCLTFSRIELQMLLRSCLICLRIIIV